MKLHSRTKTHTHICCPSSSSSSPRAQRRYCDIYYDCDTGNFQIVLDGVDKVFTLSHIDGRHGPLQCWDLHVGARITALGRHMTLMQASGATLEWLEMRSIQLQKMKRQFVKEVRDVGGGASEWEGGGRAGGKVMVGGGEGGGWRGEAVVRWVTNTVPL